MQCLCSSVQNRHENNLNSFEQANILSGELLGFLLLRHIQESPLPHSHAYV